MIEGTPGGALLADADQVYVGIQTSRGPHVTPELFAVQGERVVCMTAATTLKAKRARREPVVAVAARAGSTVLAGLGTVELVDPARPTTAIGSPVASALGAARFVKENVFELAGATRDALGGRLGLPPPHRVLFAVTLGVAVVVDGDEVTWSTGWDADGARAPNPDGEADEDGADPDLDGVPEHLAALVAPGDVVLGWTTEEGRPLALPARWEGDGAASVAGALFGVTRAAASSPACATFDAWSGLGPTGKQGVMLRGAGAAQPTDAGRVRVTLDVERVTVWDGVENQSIDVDDGSG